MDNIAIIHHTLDMGGGEKLVYELCLFYLKKGINPTVFVINNAKKEYYDDKLKQLKVEVVRFNTITKKDIYRLKFTLWDLWWKFNTRFRFHKMFKRVIFVNLASARHYYQYFSHNGKIFWHVGNQIQYPNRVHPFIPDIIKNPQNTIVLINKYQKHELESQFGTIEARSEIIKLYVNE